MYSRAQESGRLTFTGRHSAPFSFYVQQRTFHGAATHRAQPLPVRSENRTGPLLHRVISTIVCESSVWERTASSHLQQVTRLTPAIKPKTSCVVKLSQFERFISLTNRLDRFFHINLKKSCLLKKHFSALKKKVVHIYTFL